MSSAPAQPKNGGSQVAGVLEVSEDGRQAWLRDPKRSYRPQQSDPQIDIQAVRQLSLRGGEYVVCPVNGKKQRHGKAQRLGKIHEVEEQPASKWESPPALEDTTAIDPDTRLRFDITGGPNSMRVVELFTPIGRGQRALIVAPPRTGKTVLLQQMAHGLAQNHPEIYMVMLLIDERPEEVTDMRRNVRGEVIASSNDHDFRSHVRVARLAIQRARRLAECGRHIVVFIDSITRLARAFNAFVGSSGRTMTGGLDIRALQEPKQMFGAARNIEGGGSLTIIATALVETGSRADDFIFQEFKGTGNMELRLDREMANLRIWPAINLPESGTRKEEKLLDEEMLAKANMLRRQLHSLPPAKAMTELLQRMERFDALDAFLGSLRH